MQLLEADTAALLKPRDFLLDFLVGFGGPGRGRRALAVAVARLGPKRHLGPVRALRARADRDDLHGEGPRPQRGSERRVSHAPRTQFAIGRQPRIHVDSSSPELLAERFVRRSPRQSRCRDTTLSG